VKIGAMNPTKPALYKQYPIMILLNVERIFFVDVRKAISRRMPKRIGTINGDSGPFSVLNGM
jgi:hypothetical protein